MSTKDYFKSVASALFYIDHDAIRSAITILGEAKRRGANVFIFGNGGSAATAIHFANDLVKMCGIKAQSLMNISVLTAYANDVGYGNTFYLPLYTQMDENDVAIGISCSGKSLNVIDAMKFAKRKGFTIGLTGNDKKAPVVELSNCCIHAPSKDIKVQEDIHMMICHAIAGELSR